MDWCDPSDEAMGAAAYHVSRPPIEYGVIEAQPEYWGVGPEEEAKGLTSTMQGFHL